MAMLFFFIAIEFGFLIYLTDSMQWSVLSLGLFFVASLIVLSRLKSTDHVY